MGTCSFFARRKQSNFGKEVVAVRRESTFWAHQSRDVTSLRARRRPHAFGVSLVAMGADPHDLLGVLRRLGLHPAGPGGALRRDAGGRAHHRRRRRLERRIGRGGAGVLHHHGVGRGDRSGGVRGAAPPGLLSPKPLDFKSRAGRSQHERLGEDVSERTDRDCDREAERRTPFSSATADDEAAALAAFELAAERALRVEEARSNRLVRAHLHEARGEQIDVTDDDENISPSPSRSDATGGQDGVLLFGRRHLRARPTALPAEAEGEMCCRDAKDARTRAREHGEISRREEDGNGRRRRRAKIFAKHETRRREGRRERRRRVSRPAVRRRRSFGARRERETNGARPDLRRIFIRGRHRVGTFGIKPRRLERRGDGGGDGVRGADA